MAGWSKLTNGYSLDCDDISNGCKDSSSCSGSSNAKKNGNDDNEVKLRCLFDQVLSVFSNDAVAMGCIRTMPPLLGNGQSVDLFELFRMVRKRGGFDLVNGFWTFVVKELGLDLQASTAVKLVYFKYLYELERWLRGSCRDGRSGDGECQADGNASCLYVELETEFRSFLLQESGNDDSKYKKNRKKTRAGVMKSDLGSLATKDAHDHRAGNGVASWHTDDDEKFHDYKKEHSNNDDNDVLILDPSIGKKISNSRKRKRESVSGMLNWLIQIAKCPDNCSIGELPPPSKWKDHKRNELWAQAIRARDALLQRRMVDSKSEHSLLQNNQKMHPSLYEDVTPVGDQPTERLRCSERLPALVKPRFCPCCNSCSASQNQSISPPKTEVEKPQKEKPVIADDSSVAKTTNSQSKDEDSHRHALVGRRFQAEVPEWTDMVYESDPKWLGTLMWSSEYGSHDNAAAETNNIGKGRPNTCDCELPGSVECVRFHIAENRMKLKLELGPVFYKWRFDRMGEELSLRWTTEEEKRFKDMVRLNPPSADKCFWDYSKKYFPRRTREELVSYYFNVFLVQRRSYQNRVTPKHIDSDDDESEFGYLSDSYGRKAIKVLGADILICSENKQCTDFT